MHTQHMPHIMIVNRLESNKERFRAEGLDQIRPHSSRSLQFDRKIRPLSFRIPDVLAKDVSGKKGSGRFVKKYAERSQAKNICRNVSYDMWGISGVETTINELAVFLI